MLLSGALGKPERISTTDSAGLAWSEWSASDARSERAQRAASGLRTPNSIPALARMDGHPVKESPCSVEP
jgi:hypothetical protein